MDVTIQRAVISGRSVWQVQACGTVFSFADQASAIAFADKLKERVEACHTIPEGTLQRWAEEHSRLTDSEPT